MDHLIGLLKEDILLFADGGGKIFNLGDQRLTAFKKPLQGRENIGRLLLSIMPKLRHSIPDFHQEIIFTNGMPSIISYSGENPFSLVSLESDGEYIRNIYVQSNPDKLKHLKKSDE
jgi:RNA polymerase sigma-70 factor (ECF subfamily)